MTQHPPNPSKHQLTENKILPWKEDPYFQKWSLTYLTKRDTATKLTIRQVSLFAVKWIIIARCRLTSRFAEAALLQQTLPELASSGAIEAVGNTRGQLRHVGSGQLCLYLLERIAFRDRKSLSRVGQSEYGRCDRSLSIASWIINWDERFRSPITIIDAPVAHTYIDIRACRETRSVSRFLPRSDRLIYIYVYIHGGVSESCFYVFYFKTHTHMYVGKYFYFYFFFLSRAVVAMVDWMFVCECTW